MKIFFILIINLIFFWIASEYKKNNLLKIELYSSLINFSNDLISQISFNKTNINEIYSKSKNSYAPVLNSIIDHYLSVSNMNNISFLNDEESQELLDFLNSVGKYDIDGVNSNINFYKNKFDNKLNILKENQKKKVEPIFKIIIILGLALSILLI